MSTNTNTTRPGNFSNFLLLLPLLLLQLSPLPGCGAQTTQPMRDLWCVAKNNAVDQALQQAIDWACGAGGANCGPIQPGSGPCYDPTDIERTASWAFNDYYLKHGLADEACSFSDNAALTSLDPSFGQCKFPSSATVEAGNVSSSTPTMQIGGFGSDSADLSGCNKTGTEILWFWTLIIASQLVYWL